MDELSLEEKLQKDGNIYEAVVVMAKRARQITDEQKKQIEAETDIVIEMGNRESEDFDEVEIDREALNREHIKMPKPTAAAIQEMIDTDIDYKYRELEEEKES